MIAIRAEIRAIEEGEAPRENNLLLNAPHTVLDLIDDHWRRPYSRAQACFPQGLAVASKYWSPVNRIDNAYGDRNPVCSCPPPEAYLSAAE
jgi:glycine dehydrogenase